MTEKESNISCQIGNIIRLKRKSKNITQKDLSVLISGNISLHGLISRIENGAHPAVPFYKIQIILNSLGIDILQILSEINKK